MPLTSSMTCAIVYTPNRISTHRTLPFPPPRHRPFVPATPTPRASRGSDAVAGGMITDAVGTKDAEGAVVGAVPGGIAGGILGAAASVLIPGLGPVMAAGILWTAMGFAGAGVAVGGILGAMAGLG